MIAVDTNVLVRLLIDDPESQSQVVAAKTLEEAVALDCELFTFDRKLSRIDGVKMVDLG